MTSTLHLYRQQADAFRAGKLRQYRVPVTPQPLTFAAASGDLFDDTDKVAVDLFKWPPESEELLSQKRFNQACPFGRASSQVELVECLPYNKKQSLGYATVKAVSVARLKGITDAEIVMEGYPNWTQYAYAWNEHYARLGSPWDIDPYVWVVEFSP
ncbi:hypothetical protein [Pseudomonas sp. NPDC096950]|uniref:hypothetical protein n=1 Tax=Pseudomonas sp. NPDC096950 TaxID=3364485 RepID=UPI00383BA9C9